SGPPPPPQPLGELPVEPATGSGGRRVEEDHVGTRRRRVRDRRITRAEALDHELHALTDPADLGLGLTAVELGTAQTRAVDDLDDPLGPLVTEGPDSRDAGRETLKDVAHVRLRHLD